MAGTGSPMPFIKNEPDDQNFALNSFGSYNHGQQYGSWNGPASNDEMGDFNMNGVLSRPPFGSQQNLSSNFIAGSSAIDDDDLTADFIDYESGVNKSNNQVHQNGTADFNGSQQQYNMGQGVFNQLQSNSIQGSRPGSYMQTLYSNTPPGGPIQSPFVNSFNYEEWASMQSRQQRMAHQNQPSSLRNGSVQSRPGIRNIRTGSDARSPRTPKTPGQGNAQFGTPDSSAFDSQGIPVNQANQTHRQSSSTQWDSGISSGPSYLESPLASPISGPTHLPISSVIESTKHASLPAKSEFAPGSVPTTNAEAKKRRRRESHNAVERRRRDNINDRIQELARLVPAHRLEDDRMRKQLATPGSLTATGNGMSPPQATSLLAGGSGRRAAGSITQGIPIDDKDKNPAKGDVLNGAVAWARDLMWLLHRKIQQEGMLMETIENLGGQMPYESGEDEQRMETELLGAIERNGAANFDYSRTDGSGLYVPKHTDTSGSRLQHGFDPNALPSAGAGSNYNDQDVFVWDYNAENDSVRDSPDFKEEDEFGMDVG